MEDQNREIVDIVMKWIKNVAKFIFLGFYIYLGTQL